MRISQNDFSRAYYVVFVCFNLGMEATVEKIEKLFDRFNVWDLLGENYWAMLLADRPEYAKQKHLKIKSVAYNPLIVMESNKHIYSKNSKTRKGWAPFRLPTSIRGDSKWIIIRKLFTYINISTGYCCLVQGNG